MSKRVPSKKALKIELLEQLEKTRASLVAAHLATKEGATHEEAKPENDKDTRALEQSYLARGQAMRIEALLAGLAKTTAMDVSETEVARAGALLEAEDEKEQVVRFFLAPEGGGVKLSGDVQVVTPSSPLGDALVGKRKGDDVELKLAGKTRSFSVLSVK